MKYYPKYCQIKKLLNIKYKKSLTDLKNIMWLEQNSFQNRMKLNYSKAGSINAFPYLSLSAALTFLAFEIKFASASSFLRLIFKLSSKF